MTIGMPDALPAGDALQETMTVTRNLSTRYLAIGVELIVGLLVLPFNIAHLGQSAYGLWMLTTSITAYFSLLDLGYGGALVKFVAQYRARRDPQGLNEILSTTFYLFAVCGVLTCLVALVLASQIDHLVSLEPSQIRTGQIVLLVTSLTVALGTAFSVFGAVTNGFQRYDLNNIAGASCSVVVAVVNVLTLLAGFRLVGLVVATTIVRILTYLVYRRNAYHVFPGLSLRLRHVSRARFREVTSFSVYVLGIDWASKLNYSIDAVVIGIFLNTSAVAVWSIGQRLAEATQRLTNQLNDVLFPLVVDHDTSSRLDRLQAIFLVGTRLSLASVIPIAGVLLLMAGPLVRAWVGPAFADSVVIVQLLSITVALRVGSATSTTVLKGAGSHRLLAAANLVTAAVNVTLSVLLIGPLGLRGVAFATLGPVALVCLCVIFPAACRRVGVPLTRAVADAVWPAVWPAVPMAAYILATRRLVGPSLLAVTADMLAGALVYVVTFLAFGLTNAERRFCLSRLTEATGRARMLLPTPSGGA